MAKFYGLKSVYKQQTFEIVSKYKIGKISASKESDFNEMMLEIFKAKGVSYSNLHSIKQKMTILMSGKNDRRREIQSMINTKQIEFLCAK